jgi:hypothetical protein
MELSTNIYYKKKTDFYPLTLADQQLSLISKEGSKVVFHDAEGNTSTYELDEIEYAYLKLSKEYACTFWMETNINDPYNKGNVFLCRYKHTKDLSDWDCIGSVDKDGEHWTATINQPYDEENESDALCLGQFQSRDEAIQVLWNNRSQAY